MHNKSVFQMLPLLFLVSSCISPVNENKENTTRLVSGGEISGEYSEETGIYTYKGIPFAAPPTGDFRWKAPQPVIPWEGVKECTAFGPSPIQPEPRPFMFWSSEFLIPESPISEDCLYLNVWSGAAKEDKKRPVLVYIYGGGFQSGGSACPIYDGTSMAEKGIVFVSFNYRVGKFGFLAHPELSEESGTGSSGNYALLDMIAALEWVQSNISAFGGDPENVTIAGQSAGSFAVNYLTAAPQASGLFHRVIGESGAQFYPSPLRPSSLTPAEADSLGVVFARSLGATSLQELRDLPADRILEAPGGLSGPYIDGHILPQSVLQTYREGKQSDVPMLIGWNENDIVMGEPKEEEEFRGMITERFGDMENRFYEAYPLKTEEDLKLTQFHMSRDETFGIQVYTWGKMQDSTGNSPVFMYNFNRSLPAHTPETQFGAFHSGEIVYAYDNLHTLDRPWEATDHDIARIMSSYWVNFIIYGNPNGKELPEWKEFTRNSEYVQVIQDETRSEVLPTRDELMFWETYYQINQRD